MAKITIQLEKTKNSLLELAKLLIRIVDRKNLERTACECCDIVKAEYKRLFD
jgi:hypothetical protein